MKRLPKYLALGVSVLFLSCHDTGEANPEESFIAFGVYDRYCAGENCEEFFRLESDRLVEYRNDDYAGEGYYEYENVEMLSQDKFEAVSDLWDFVPQALLDDPNTHIGVPEVSDVGIIYVEIRNASLHKYWTLEFGDFDMPAAYKDFMLKINEKIQLLQ